MTTFQLKGDILSYKYTNSESTPSSDFTGKVGFSDSLSDMSVNSKYTLYISTLEIGGDNVYNIIDRLDGVESDRKYPGKDSKVVDIESSRCSISSPRENIVFDILYDTQTYDATNKFISFSIKIVSKISTSNFINNETLYFTYNIFGSGGYNPTAAGGIYQVKNSTPSGNGDIQLINANNASNYEIKNLTSVLIGILI